MKRVLDFARRWRFDRRAVVIAAIALLGAGLFLALVNESGYAAQKQREGAVQAQILAASVAPALMFDAASEAQAYLNALAANPNVAAAAVYDEGGARVSTFNRVEAPEPPLVAPAVDTGFDSGRVVAVTPVERDGAFLGSVYLATTTDPWLRRFAGYIGIGILVIMAALVLVVLGLAQAALHEANAQLDAKARDLQVQIEQREKAEEALLQSSKMEAIGQLTGGVAHDFNNLLMVVISGLRLLERHADPERRAKTMEAMRQAVERGAGLTRQLLAFSRRQTLSLEAVDVTRQISNMRELLERSLRADILVDLNLPDGLWPVRTDPAQLELAILNLAVNARDAMPKGGVITITAENVTLPASGDRPLGDYVRITVRDTGMGMPPDILARVFEPYFTTKQTGQGTGLGLSQVYGFVSQSGGSVSIESVVNQGTSMTLTLPRSEQAPLTQAPPPAREPKRGASRRVLVVEDEDQVAGFVCEMLSQLGHEPMRVANAAQALDAVDPQKFDLVFSDIIMPGGMNGIELACEIRRRHPRLPILLTTGYSGGPTEGADFPLLRKPYQMEELEEALAAVGEGAKRAATV